MKRAKLVYYLISFIIVLTFISLAGSVSFILALNTKAIPTPTPSPSATLTSSPTITPQPAVKAKIASPATPAPTSSPTPSPDPSSTPALSASINSPVDTPTPTPAAKLFVKLSINGGSILSVEVEEGNNQCDVLSQALKQGKISQLNMKYDSNLNTYAVYQINGVGKENSVWWTYAVGGTNPPLGCSFIKAKNGDSVEWRYIGS